jgi:hypothetical protein
MTKFFIDGQERKAPDTRGEQTIGEFLAESVTTLASSQKMICELAIDGVTITEDSLQSIVQRDIATVGIMALRTMTFQELARFGLERTELMLQQVVLEAERSAESFRSTSPEEANRTYVVCLEDLQLSVDMVEQLLKLQEGAEDHGGQSSRDSLRTYLDKLAMVTGELLLAHRRNDVMVLADVLTYELIPLLQTMREVLRIQHKP